MNGFQFSERGWGSDPYRRTMKFKDNTKFLQQFGSRTQCKNPLCNNVGFSLVSNFPSELNQDYLYQDYPYISMISYEFICDKCDMVFYFSGLIDSLEKMAKKV